MAEVIGRAGPRVVVLGDVMVDVVAVMRGRLAWGSDSPASVGLRPGGSAANVAAWLAVQGVEVTFVGRVGDDGAGREALAGLERYGVRAAAAVDPALPTGTCVVLVGPDGERTMLPDAGANRALAPEHLPLAAFRPGDHLHLSGYTLLDPRSRPAALAALDLAAERRMTVSVDPSSSAPLAEAGPACFLEWTRGADLLLPNRSEAAVLTGETDPRAAAARLAEEYAEVVVKLDGAGALWHGGFITASAPARDVEVVDTTGAGDAFAAGFLSAWLLHPEPETALANGNRVAAECVQVLGARPPA